MSKTPIDFCDELLQAWGQFFFDTELYKEWGMSHSDAIVQVFQWSSGAKENVDILKQFHNLIGLAIGYLEKRDEETSDLSK